MDASWTLNFKSEFLMAHKIECLPDPLTPGMATNNTIYKSFCMVTSQVCEQHKKSIYSKNVAVNVANV